MNFRSNPAGPTSLAWETYVLPAVKNVAVRHSNSKLKIIPNCGHVVNIEKHKIFNEYSINFLIDRKDFKKKL